MALNSIPVSGNQYVIVMRHGERLDNVDYTWDRKEGKDRPYDPPLTSRGKKEVHQIVSERFKSKGIKKIISSPFLRCLQTAQMSCKALDLPGIIIDNGMCEVLAPGFKVNHSPDVPVSNLAAEGIEIIQHDKGPMPPYPERFNQAMKRYRDSISRIAEEYYPENVLIVTHQYGVEEAVVLAIGERSLHEADYCCHVELTREDRGTPWKIVSKFRLDWFH